MTLWVSLSNATALPPQPPTPGKALPTHPRIPGKALAVQFRLVLSQNSSTFNTTPAYKTTKLESGDAIHGTRGETLLLREKKKTKRSRAVLKTSGKILSSIRPDLFFRNKALGVESDHIYACVLHSPPTSFYPISGAINFSQNTSTFSPTVKCIGIYSHHHHSTFPNDVKNSQSVTGRIKMSTVQRKHAYIAPTE